MANHNDIYNYYASEEFLEKLELPRNAKWRHYRGKDAEGRWKKIPIQVHDKEDLQRWIIKLGLIDVFYSTSEWLNPTKVSGRVGPTGPGYMVADNLIVGASTLVFDIDADTPLTEKGLNNARKSTNNIYQAMKRYQGMEFEYCSFTGRKGFRLCYKDNNIGLPGDGSQRYEFINEYRKVFIERLLKEISENASEQGMYKIEVFFDEKVTTNPMYIVRVIGTAHGKTGLLSTSINPELLRSPFKKLITHIPSVGKETLAIPYWEMTTTEDNKILDLGHKQQGKDESRVTSLPPHFIGMGAYFTTNRVLGIKKGYVPIFMYNETQKYYRKELLELQEKYKLGNIYVYRSGKNIIGLSLKTMQRRQLQRLLNESGSTNKHTFKKYKQLFMPLIMSLEEEITGKHTGHLSAAHASFVNPRKNVNNKERFVGWKQLVIVRAEKHGNQSNK